MGLSVPEYKITPSVSLDPRFTALVVVDMQVDFASPKGKLFVPEARKTIPAIHILITKARKAKVPVIFSQDWHRPDDPEFLIWPPHAVEGTRGAQVIPELKPLRSDYFIRKRTYDAFFATDLDLLLRQKGIKNLIISGTVANICVLHTAGSARLRGYEIIVPFDAISSLTPFDQVAALRQISFIYQGKITKSQGIKFQK
ncbi:MAG: isochorismatase family cysteine hydrolase [Thermodesulfobacteriota bacterium]|nr:isochorismatase family cysteine hydrolase [Thermodesulfobacteriota bacterium]